MADARGYVHQLARQTGHGRTDGNAPHTIWARCGLVAQLTRPADGLPGAPFIVTASSRLVTCPVCQHPPSWHDAGIPT